MSHKTTTNLPHDAFVRKVLKRLPLVRQLFQLVLGPAKAAGINWHTLQPADTALVTSTLKRRNLDLLFSVLTNTNQPLNLMLILEHKSHPPAQDKSPMLQLLKYEVAVYEALEDHRNATNTQRRKAGQPTIDTPIGKVSSVLFYHGSRPWQVPTWPQWTGADQVPEAAVLPGINDYTYTLCDLSTMTDQQLVTFFGHSADLLVMALFARHSHDKNIDAERVDYLLKMAYTQLSVQEGIEILDELSAYIAEMVKPEHEAAVYKTVGQYNEPLKQKLMSIAEAKRLQGIAEEKRSVAINSIEAGLSNEVIVKITGLPPAEVTALRNQHFNKHQN